MIWDAESRKKDIWRQLRYLEKRENSIIEDLARIEGFLSSGIASEREASELKGKMYEMLRLVQVQKECFLKGDTITVYKDEELKNQADRK